MNGRTWAGVTVWLGISCLIGFSAFGADKNVEFGIEDDLTVNGIEGNAADADLEVKGYSLFGSTNGFIVPAGFANGAGSVVVASNLYVNGKLQAGQIDLSGANMVVSNLTVQGYLKAAGSSLSILKDASIQSNLTVTGATTLSGNSSVGGTLGVTGVATLSSSATVAGTLGVAGNGTFQNDIQVNRDATVGGDLGVTGDGTVGGALGVAGAVTLDSDLTVKGNLATWGTGAFGKNLTAATNAFLATSGGAVGVGTSTVDANTTLQTVGGGAPGSYAAKFYCGSDLAAWIRKK